jgi:hypothetical protein
MARGQPWADDELKALRAIDPTDRSAVASFCETFPARSRGAVSYKLGVLRRRSQAADVARAVRNPFPAYRFA